MQKKETKIPIVTVGNISFGGTGKTPFLLLLLKHFPQSVAYVSCGYGRKGKKNFVGRGSQCSYDDCGDEAMLVARRYKNVVVSIARDKWDAVQNVPQDAKLIVLDDGLQRYDIPQAIEIATVDVQNPDAYGGLFPRGLLREPLSRLKKVDYIVLTNVPLNQDPEVIRKEYETRFNTRVLVVQSKIVRFFSPEGKTEIIDKARPVALFSAIASPKRVDALMKQQGFCVVGHLTFPDHVDVEPETLYTYCEKVRKAFPDAILVGTEKDYVKKTPWKKYPLPLLFSEMENLVIAGEGVFQDLLEHIKRFCEHVEHNVSKGA